jgi:hypothetical protein
MRRCNYYSTPLVVQNDNQTFDTFEEFLKVIDYSMSVGPNYQAPYGFWMNETTIIINTATNNFLKRTNFNYSCKPTNNPNCRDNYILLDPITVNGLPQLADCSVLVTIPGLKIANSSTKFCEAVQITENTVTGGFGFKTSTVSNNTCEFKVKDDKDWRYYISLSPGSYRFFLEVKEVACVNRGDGLYSDCNDIDFNLMVSLPMSFDWGNEIQIVQAQNTVGSGFSLSVKNPFEDLFSSVASTILIWIVIVCIIVATIVFGIFLL